METDELYRRSGCDQTNNRDRLVAGIIRRGITSAHRRGLSSESPKLSIPVTL